MEKLACVLLVDNDTDNSLNQSLLKNLAVAEQILDRRDESPATDSISG